MRGRVVEDDKAQNLSMVRTVTDLIWTYLKDMAIHLYFIHPLGDDVIQATIFCGDVKRISLGTLQPYGA